MKYLVSSIKIIFFLFSLYTIYHILYIKDVYAQTFEKFSFENSEKLKPLINWHDYNQDAFTKAGKEKKPVFLLLTAPGWCYACQEYESLQSLYNPKVVKLINEKFIPIYVDSDKRADLTRQYLQRGWPTTIILTPQKNQLTAFLGRRSPTTLLNILHDALNRFQNNSNLPNQPLPLYKKTPQIIPTDEQLVFILSKHISFIKNNHDQVYGGFGTTGRKYPQGRSLDFMLDLYELTNDSTWLEMVKTTQQNQYTLPDQTEKNYHLYDPIEGGFHRFSSERSWKNPHFEKMLYDNARLLKTYHHLLKLTSDPLTQKIVAETQRYMVNNWYDEVYGGFYSSTDPGGGGSYYLKKNRIGTLRIEKTKYVPDNAEAILTFLSLYKNTNNKDYKDIAEKSLAWAMSMQSINGAYHYQTKDGEKQVQGNILDNAYLLLALTEGYEILKNERYLQTAKQLANYSLNNLYDLISGGFFERNSKDQTLYAINEQMLLNKPFEENSIMAYAFLKLYQFTKNPEYLGASVKTMGFFTPFYANTDILYARQSAEGFYVDADSGYYFIQAIRLTQKENLLSGFEQNENVIIQKEQKKLKTFWLTNYLKNDEKSSVPLVLFFLVAFLAGMFSVLSPCVLPILPSVLAYSLKSSKHNIFGMTISFFAGLSLIFITLGASATLIGRFLQSFVIEISQLSGILIMGFGIFTLLGKGIPGLTLKQKKPASYLGAFFFGTAFGLSWSPCVGPILVSLLAVAATVDSIFKGAVLLFFYTLGLSIPLLVFAFFLKKQGERSIIWKVIKGKELTLNMFGKHYTIHSTTLISGMLFLLVGYLMFSGTLYTLNKFVAQTFFQKLLFTSETWLLKFLPNM